MTYLENETIYRERYRILRRLGEGGSSVVYMAFDEKCGEPVTLKLFRENPHGKKMTPDTARIEMEVLSGLSHQSIPKLREAYDDAAVMSYIPGNSLEKALARKGRFSEKEAVRIGTEILEVLEYLHERDIPVIYRDLKPANVMLRPDGHISLIDFGACRLMEKEAGGDTLNLGTNGFAAPEQYGNLGQTDPRTDIYCFGRTLLQLAGGRCSYELMEIIEKCTMPDREDRFTDCREVEIALKRYPLRVAGRRVLRGFKLAAGSAVMAGIISFALLHYDAVRSYAADDARERMPAVQQRLNIAGVRLKEMLREQFGVVIGEDAGADDVGYAEEIWESER